MHSYIFLFLGKLNPNDNEKRSQFLSSASLVGESVFILLNSLNADEAETAEEQNFFSVLNESIQTVANSAAGLVLQLVFLFFRILLHNLFLRAKNLPGSPTDLPRENIIQAATRVALYTR